MSQNYNAARMQAELTKIRLEYEAQEDTQRYNHMMKILMGDDAVLKIPKPGDFEYTEEILQDYVDDYEFQAFREEEW